VTQPIYAERWVTPPEPPAYCPAAHAAAVAGTSEVWNMAGGYPSYGLANPGARPPSVFRVFDPADPREIIRVDSTAGPNWTVARATEGSLGVDHAAGFEVAPFITQAGLNGRAAGTPTRSGMVLRSALTAPLNLTGDVDHLIASMLVPAGEAIAGSIYEVQAWGYYTPGVAYSPPPTFPAATPHFNCALRWNPPGVVGSIAFPLPAAQASSRWRIHATLNLHGAGGPHTSTINLWAATAAAPGTPVTPAALFGPTPVNSPPNVAVDATFAFQISTGLPNGTIPAAATLTVLGARIGRGA
jgi:hypothetical protein